MRDLGRGGDLGLGGGRREDILLCRGFLGLGLVDPFADELRVGSGVERRLVLGEAVAISDRLPGCHCRRIDGDRGAGLRFLYGAESGSELSRGEGFRDPLVQLRQDDLLAGLPGTRSLGILVVLGGDTAVAGEAHPAGSRFLLSAPVAALLVNPCRGGLLAWLVDRDGWGAVMIDTFLGWVPWLIDSLAAGGRPNG
ncbi:hypothetical protein ACIRPT_33630 [Streptomyces sp. NPDC101227]|uniref:hypothetical protein n=1 Tax=Streptomyces sp. NPDC101227 TaxID=3366136 RepID=UPI0037FDD315